MPAESSLDLGGLRAPARVSLDQLASMQKTATTHSTSGMPKTMVRIVLTLVVVVVVVVDSVDVSSTVAVDAVAAVDVDTVVVLPVVAVIVLVVVVVVAGVVVVVVTGVVVVVVAGVVVDDVVVTTRTQTHTPSFCQSITYYAKTQHKITIKT